MAKRLARASARKTAGKKMTTRLAKLGVAAGDPLQLTGLPIAEVAARAARAAALKSAHARFKDRAKQK